MTERKQIGTLFGKPIYESDEIDTPKEIRIGSWKKTALATLSKDEDGNFIMNIGEFEWERK